MTGSSLQRIGLGLALGILVLGFAAPLAAEKVQIEGIITTRNGDQVTIQYANGAVLTFVLTDTTEVSQVGELSDPRRKNMAMAVLIPGLKVKAEGVYSEQRQILATSIKFKGGDLEDAQKMQAGMHELKVENQQQQAELDQKTAQLQAQQEQLAEQQRQLDANKAAIAANTARFGQLDDYYIWDEVTVLFGNGKVKVEPEYEKQLLAMAEKAKTVDGYVIEVVGYASAAGSAALNQKLSQERADNVTNILVQKAQVPLTRMLAPGAMGEAHQVGDDKTAEQQAENRRVVVRVLQNKAVSGIHEPLT